MTVYIKKLYLDEGQGLMEYSLIIAFVVLIVSFALRQLGGQVLALFNTFINHEALNWP
ncbi:MAG: Flp family type IVb pilin [Dethiobacteria bacterium]|nr:Flp family type IVb pilin [Bacillota bacterium]